MEKAFLSHGATLVTNTEIPGVTQDLSDHERYFGAKYMIAQGITPNMASMICGALALEFDGNINQSDGMQILFDAIKQAVGPDTYFCSRDWSAWSVGTMSKDDFHDLRDSEEIIEEICQAVLSIYGTPPEKSLEKDSSSITVKIKRELFRFESKQDWIDNAQTRYQIERANVPKGHFLAVDANGHVAHQGRCFNYAGYPVIVYELKTNWIE